MPSCNITGQWNLLDPAADGCSYAVSLLPSASTGGNPMDPTTHDYAVHCSQFHACIPSTCSPSSAHTTRNSRRGGRYRGGDSCYHSRVSSSRAGTGLSATRTIRKKDSHKLSPNMHKCSLHIRLTLNPLVGRDALVLNPSLRERVGS